jgi:LAO/AO transport system kinase
MPLPADPAALLAAAREGGRGALAKLLSLAEGPEAAAVDAAIHPYAGQAQVIGITGAPGAGKSSLVDALITHVRGRGEDVAVLAIDPTSPFSGGAILGDRVRMQEHALDPGVFIRSMATRGSLGGLSAAAPAAIRVLDAAGKPYILVETVGVGQVEVEIVEAADTVVVVVNPGWGDAIQAAKAGLLEIADVFVVNKADRPGVDECVQDLEAMIDMAVSSTRRPPVVRTVATTGEGVAELWEAIEAHWSYLCEDDRLVALRRARLADEVRTILVDMIGAMVRAQCSGAGFEAILDDVASHRCDPHSAARKLLGDIRLDASPS